MKKWFFEPLIIAGVVTSVSCLKKPNLQEDDKPATMAAVQSSLASTWGHADPATMNTNDFVYMETEQTIEQQDPRLVLQEGITVSQKNESSTDLNYTFLYQASTITNGQTQQSTREDHRCVAKTSDGCSGSSTQSSATLASSAAPVTTTSTNSNAVSASAVPVSLQTLGRMQAVAEVKQYSTDLQMTLGFERLINLAYACEKTDALTTYCKDQLKLDSCDIECSNLQVIEDTQDPPDLIKQQPGCGGLANCKLHVKTVSFDWSFKQVQGSVTQKQKINYSITLSQDLPFLARMTDYCSRGLIDVPTTGSKVLVSVCNHLRNYKSGTP